MISPERLAAAAAAWQAVRLSPGPFLRITADELAERTRITIVNLMALMVFPDDGNKQRRYAAADVAAIIAAIPENSFQTSSGKALVQALGVAGHLLGGLGTEVERRCDIGYAIAGAFITVIGDPTARLGDVLARFEKVSQCNYGTGRARLPIERLQTNWWPRFRPVAHLWAAHLAIWRPGYPLFPCTPDDLPDFLAASEYLRYRAACRPLARQGVAALVPRGIAWAVPAEIALPFPKIVIGDQRETWHADDFTEK